MSRLSSLVHTVRRNRQIRATIPGTPGLPLLGHSLTFLYNPVDAALHFEKELGSVYWVSAFGQTMVGLIGPEANQLVLRNTEQAFSNHQGWAFFIGTFFKRGLMLLDFDEHKMHRGIMQAAFKKPMMVGYLERMGPLIARGVRAWPAGKRVSAVALLKSLTLDVATEVFMDERLGPEADRLNQDFIDCVLAGTALIRYPVPGGRHWRGLQARQRLEAFFRSRLAHRRAHPSTDLFSQLCVATDEEGRRFSDDDVVNHMIFLLMAAHDTTTLTLAGVLYQLGKHPEWQTRLREEMAQLGRDTLTHDDLKSLPLTDAVINEALRLHAPVHGIPRKTVKPVHFQGHDIPVGSFIIISPYVTHRLAAHWTDPDRFDPSRFLPDRAEHKKHPYQFLPFGGGAHMCIGLHFADLEIKSVLHALLREWTWTLPAKYTMPVNFTSLPSPADGLPLVLHRVERAQ